MARYVHRCQEMIDWACGLDFSNISHGVSSVLGRVSTGYQICSTLPVPLCVHRGLLLATLFLAVCVSWAASLTHLLCSSWGCVASPKCVGDAEGSHSTEVCLNSQKTCLCAF